MLKLIGFDGDDTLWRSQDYFDAASNDFAAIIGRYVDLGDDRVNADALVTEQRNLQLFGYGAKGMTLSMVETAIAITEARITAQDIHRIVEIGKAVLQHPVELLPDVREAVQAVTEHHEVVLITKGDLFHQEKKVAQSGMASLFRRIEIVSEKDTATYRRLIAEFDVKPNEFAMVGNSLRSDIEPVLRLGGWAVHMPYHLTWAHELENTLGDSHSSRMRVITSAAEIALAVAQLAELAAA